MQNKLKVREDLIRQLRRYIALELVQVRINGPDETRHRVLEASKEEPLKILSLMDEVRKLQMSMDEKCTAINKLRYVIAYQSDKIKRMAINEEKVTFTYKDKLRKIEKEKNIFRNNAQSLTSEIDELNTKIESLQSELASIQGALQLKSIEFESNEKLIKSLRDELNKVKVERDDAVNHLRETEFDWESVNEEVKELRDKNRKLTSK